MKAVIQEGNGLRIADIAAPRPQRDDVLVRVRACALNRADLAMLAGKMHGAHGGPGTVLGLEYAGEVIETGANVTNCEPGDRVMCSGKGAFAEYALSDWGRVVPIPSAAMSYEEAVCLPVALQTMHDALVTNGGMKTGSTVLIQGASSGVGLMGLQIARCMGARLVFGTSTTHEKRERLHDFGADMVLDSRDEAWVAKVIEATDGKGVDVIADQLAGRIANQNMKATAIGGRIVNVGRLAGMHSEFDFDLHALRRIHYVGVTFRTRSVAEVREINKRMLADLRPHLREGRLTLPIDRIFALDKVADALAYMSRNEHFGKIVLTVQ